MNAPYRLAVWVADRDRRFLWAARGFGVIGIAGMLLWLAFAVADRV